jgi:hypothetical protein
LFCRLKIRNEVEKSHGQAILWLGYRKEEKGDKTSNAALTKWKE